MTSPFDYINSITTTKEDLSLLDNFNKDYSSFMVNHGLAQHLDIVILASEANKRMTYNPLFSYKYLFYSVLKKKRYGGKWTKKVTNNDDRVPILSMYYTVSYERASEIAAVLTDAQYNDIKSQLDYGVIK